MPLEANHKWSPPLSLLELSLATPEENLACDEALLDLAEAGGPEVLRFWEPPRPFVVVGHGNHVALEVRTEACVRDHIPILRRCSGGGTVLQTAGCLNYALVLRTGHDGPLATVTGANRFILERHRAVLEALLGRPVAVQGHTDLALDGRKCSGNAQRRKRHALLFHGTFLLACDTALFGEYLRPPSRMPEYRQGRSHADFVTNLGLSGADLRAALSRCWEAPEPRVEAPMERIRQLVREKYSRREWNLKFMLPT